MKKIINILLAVCLMVSVLSVSALAETYPLTHTYPTLIDFNDETTGRYDEVTEIPNNFYHFRKYVEVSAYEGSTTDKYLFINSTSGVNSAAGIKFADFAYDAAAAEAGNVQPKKLVISMDIDYDFTTTSQKTLGGGHATTVYTRHIMIGEADDTFVQQGNSPAPHSSWTAAWDYYTDNAGNVTGTLYSGSRELAASKMNNQAHLAKISRGDKVNYTFVIDLTRDSYGRANYYVYIDGISSGKLDGGYDVETVNAISFAGSKEVDFKVDNVRIYTIDNAKIAKTNATVKSGEDVVSTEAAPVTTDEVTIDFSHEITAAADEYLVVKKGTEVLEAGDDYTIEHVYSTEEGTAKTAKSLKVKFNEALSYGTTYTIGGSADYFGIDGYALEAETEFASFTTEAAPQINLSNFVVTKGFFGGTTVENLNDVIGNTANVKVTVANEEGSAAVGTVFFGVYKNDVLVSLAFVNKTFAVDETEDVTANLKVPAVSDGDTLEIKAFACESLGNLDAYATPLSVSIAD